MIRAGFLQNKIGWIAIFAVLIPFSAFSAVRAKRHVPRKLEVYSAIDSNAEGVADPGLFAPVRAGSLGSPVRIVRVAGDQHPVVAPHKEAADSRNVATPPYDNVPTDQVEPLITRLRLVGLLILRYGRAYDYRTLTIKDLETVLKRLEANEAFQARLPVPSSRTATLNRDDAIRASIRRSLRGQNSKSE